MPVGVKFTAEQQAQVDRLSPERRADLSDEKLAKRTPDQLRARVNILGVGASVVMAPENDYSPDDTALIQAVRPRVKWMLAIPDLLAEATTLRAEGMSEAAIAVILKRN